MFILARTAEYQPLGFADYTLPHLNTWVAAISTGESGNVGLNCFFPRSPAGRAPAPCVVRPENNRLPLVLDGELQAKRGSTPYSHAASLQTLSHIPLRATLKDMRQFCRSTLKQKHSFHPTNQRLERIGRMNESRRVIRSYQTSCRKVLHSRFADLMRWWRYCWFLSFFLRLMAASSWAFSAALLFHLFCNALRASTASCSASEAACFLLFSLGHLSVRSFFLRRVRLSDWPVVNGVGMRLEMMLNIAEVKSDHWSVGR